ncbi:MAG: PAS domain-containing protein [Desulfonatronovibrionaceae bacterium]
MKKSSHDSEKKDQCPYPSGAISYELIMGICNECIWDWDLVADKVRLSPCCARMLGYTLEELCGPVSIWQSLIHKEDLPAVLKAHQECIENLSSFFNVEFRMRTRSREWLWLLGRGKAVRRGPDQKALRIMARHSDITPLKKSQQKLQEAYVMTRSILDSINAVITVIDLESHEVLFINRRGRAMFGDITGGKCWKNMQMGQTSPCPFCPNHKLMDLNGFPTGVLRWECHNQKVDKWFDCHDLAVKWIDERMVKVQSAIDITARKMTEEHDMEKEHDSEDQVYSTAHMADRKNLRIHPSNRLRQNLLSA